MLILTLTEDQSNKLLEVLEETQDSGPIHEGWKSDELIELERHIESQIIANKT